jgi:hypothetical protein
MRGENEKLYLLQNNKKKRASKDCLKIINWIFTQHRTLFWCWAWPKLPKIKVNPDELVKKLKIN